MLTGRERGQYDLRLGANSEFYDFFSPFPAEDPTDLGGWSRLVRFEPFTGKDPVPACSITFRYMGQTSARKDFYFASQKHDLAESYPLWRPGRAAPLDASFDDIKGAVVIVARDANDAYHARWLSREAVDRLPKDMRSHVKNSDKGVYEVPSITPAGPPQAQEVIDSLRTHHNVLLYGPPGTGKTHLVQQVLQSFGGGFTIDSDDEHDPISDAGSTRTAWVTFHQSYSYEDFLVGIRPRPHDSGGFSLEPVAGTLMELSEWARQPGNQSLLVIDEINRGNVSRIFGELITLLEVDKRLDGDGSVLPETVSVRLPYLTDGDELRVLDGEHIVPNPFTMPKDLYILATMNSVDTSVAPLDAALRRRFQMIHLAPNTMEMAEVLGLSGTTTLPPLDLALPNRKAVVTLALHLLDRINYGVAQFLGEDFGFGHWYLRPLRETASREAAVTALASVWRSKLAPQLVEHFNGRTEQLLAILGNPKSQQALVVSEPTPSWESLGGTTLVSPVPSASDEDVIQLLLDIVSQPLA
jgi:MoxR-like ATPase